MHKIHREDGADDGQVGDLLDDDQRMCRTRAGGVDVEDKARREEQQVPSERAAPRLALPPRIGRCHAEDPWTRLRQGFGGPALWTLGPLDPWTLNRRDRRQL